MQRQGHGHSGAADLGVFREQAVLGASREWRGGAGGGAGQPGTEPVDSQGSVSALPFFPHPPTAWQRLGWVRTGSKCSFPMSPHVVSGQRPPPTHFLAGKVLTTPPSLLVRATHTCSGCLLGHKPGESVLRMTRRLFCLRTCKGSVTDTGFPSCLFGFPFATPDSDI